MIKQQAGITGKLFDIFVRVVLILMVAASLYPFIYVFSMSISDYNEVLKGNIWLLPKGFSLEAYKLVFDNPDIIRSYYNTIWYTVVGTFLSVFATVLAAYPLSRRNFFGRRPFSLAILFTLYFSGGMIPSFLIVKNLGLVNTRWALIIPGLIVTYNLIVCRTYFETIPESMIESAKIDGANDIRTFFSIVLPTSMPIVAVILLFYAVDKWNIYFPALIYLSGKPKLQPIQIFLSKVLTQNSTSATLGGMQDQGMRASMGVQMKYAIMMITILPIIMVYPFIQRYFVKGVMLGSIKE